jgi:hypothetical protein
VLKRSAVRRSFNNFNCNSESVFLAPVISDHLHVCVVLVFWQYHADVQIFELLVFNFRRRLEQRVDS